MGATMNEYAATAMMQEATLDARCFIVVVGDHHLIRDALRDFERVEERWQFGARVRRANGAERVDLPSGGRITFATPRGYRLRGMAADVVFIDNDADRVLYDADGVTTDAVRRFSEDVQCVLASRGGRVVHS